MKTGAPQALPSKALSTMESGNEHDNDSSHSLKLASALLFSEDKDRHATLTPSSKIAAESHKGSSGTLGQASLSSLAQEKEYELEFLKRVPAQRRWKNKRFWKTPVRRNNCKWPATQTPSPFQSNSDEEATKRRSCIHDSLLKGLELDDDFDVGKYSF